MSLIGWWWQRNKTADWFIKSFT